MHLTSLTRFSGSKHGLLACKRPIRWKPFVGSYPERWCLSSLSGPLPECCAECTRSSLHVKRSPGVSSGCRLRCSLKLCRCERSCRNMVVAPRLPCSSAPANSLPVTRFCAGCCVSLSQRLCLGFESNRKMLRGMNERAYLPKWSLYAGQIAGK